MKSDATAKQLRLRMVYHRNLAAGLLIFGALWTGIAVLPASAQQWRFETQTGQIQSTIDPSSGSSSLLMGVRYDNGPGGFRISTGVPIGAEEPVWMAIGGWSRQAIRRENGFIAGADLAGNGFLLRDRSKLSPELMSLVQTGTLPVPDMWGYAVAGQALPMIGFEAANFQIHGRTGVSRYSGRLGQEARNRTVWLSDVQVTLSPASSFAVTPAFQHYRDSDGAYTYGGVTAIAAYGRASAWATVGQWLDIEDAGRPWAVGAAWHPHQRIALNVARRRDTFDPLYFRTANTSWSIGLSVQLSGRAQPPAPPLLASDEQGRATIRLPVSSSSSRPRIAGDFNDWQPLSMEQRDGYWTYTATLPSGVYNYAFVNEQDEWFVPPDSPGRRDDGMGGHVAILIVR